MPRELCLGAFYFGREPTLSAKLRMTIQMTSVLERKMTAQTPDVLYPSHFAYRHIGPRRADVHEMLELLGYDSLDAFIDAVIPEEIRLRRPLALPPGRSEREVLQALRGLAGMNRVFRSYIGMGYAGCFTPQVVQRNVLENPAWYTAYTPYQAEISQGRLEALLNFQTMGSDLTGMAIANASMLDEATAAAEAMTLARRSAKGSSTVFVVAGDTHPQTIEVLQPRAAPLGLEVTVANSAEEWSAALDAGCFGALISYPCSSGWLQDWRADVERVHAGDGLVVVVADLLALTLIVPPGEWGADIVVGSSQRFGMPMGCGGPHAAYMACRDELKRSLPGRLVGVSVDSHGRPAMRLALQTREQHIRREKATSNICTAQVLPAVVASMYAVYHGPRGLRRIAQRVASYTAILAKGLEQLGYPPRPRGAFDTLSLHTGAETEAIAARARSKHANLRVYYEEYLCISLDETTTRDDIELLWSLFVKPGHDMPEFAGFE